jgi:hypothetical protein
MPERRALVLALLLLRLLLLFLPPIPPRVELAPLTLQQVQRQITYQPVTNAIPLAQGAPLGLCGGQPEAASSSLHKNSSISLASARAAVL